ncbi:hypothetical protein BDW22DRAFT_1422369 [Trametopsis cervina]|nr:hypothetical protein BDW22DRAFT_1422369 [Trametopsis cervina]
MHPGLIVITEILSSALYSGRCLPGINNVTGVYSASGRLGSGNVISLTSLGPGTHSSGRSSGTNDEFRPFERAPSSPPGSCRRGRRCRFRRLRVRQDLSHGGRFSERGLWLGFALPHVDPTAAYYNHHFISKQPHHDEVTSPFPAANGPVRKNKKRSQSFKHSSAMTDSISTPPPYQTTFPTGGFPSVGFGGGRPSRKNSEAGVFLASRGD